MRSPKYSAGRKRVREFHWGGDAECCTLGDMDAAAAKADLREAIRLRLLGFSEKQRAAESRTLCRTLTKILPMEPTTIASYFPLKDEPDIRPLLRDLLQQGHHLYLPRLEGGRIVFHRAQNLSNVQPGANGIPEPPADAPLLEPQKLAYALIPGRAFDRRGQRLGRGNGGYDIWIRAERQANPATAFLGIALEPQIVQEVPVEPHDERVDALVTARGVVPCGRCDPSLRLP